ncbi:MAG: hypothetical protein BWY71_01560 [Planctomycetes bacterium ADurb.Bin412]|nr:MAG: hypothetical protein BWY71_01560 [Planctomycetes bacterium ADurb.Bin412]
MNRSKSKKRIIVVVITGLVLIIVSAALFYLRGGIMVIIHNVGTEPLQAVVVHVTGNSYPQGDIAAGATKRVKVQAQGESHIELTYGEGKHLVVDCYFEGGNKGKITAEVTSHEVIRVEQDIHVGFF